MNVMLDLNVIIDVIENRIPWVIDSAKTCSVLIKNPEFTGFITPHAITTIYYHIRKVSNIATAEKAIDWLLTSFEFATCGKNELIAARGMKLKDFEDAVLAATSVNAKCEYIITRNVADFKGAPIKAISPTAFNAMIR